MVRCMGGEKQEKTKPDRINKFLTARNDLELKARAHSQKLFQTYLKDRTLLKSKNAEKMKKAGKILEEDCLNFIEDLQMEDILEPGQGTFDSEAFADFLGLENSFRKESSFVMVLDEEGHVVKAFNPLSEFLGENIGLDLSDKAIYEQISKYGNYFAILASRDCQFVCCVRHNGVSLYYQYDLNEKSAKHIVLKESLPIPKSITGLCLSKDDTTLVIASRKVLTCINLRTSNVHKIETGSSMYRKILFQNNNFELIALSENELHVYDTITWAKKILFTSKERINDFSISPDNGDIAILTNHNVLHFIFAKGGDVGLKEEHEQVELTPPTQMGIADWGAMKYSPDGKKMLLATIAEVFIIPDISKLLIGYSLDSGEKNLLREVNFKSDSNAIIYRALKGRDVPTLTKKKPTAKEQVHMARNREKSILQKNSLSVKNQESVKNVLEATSVAVPASETKKYSINGSEMKILTELRRRWGGSAVQIIGSTIIRGTPGTSSFDPTNFELEMLWGPLPSMAFMESDFHHPATILRDINELMNSAGFSVDTDDGLNFTVEWKVKGD